MMYTVNPRFTLTSASFLKVVTGKGIPQTGGHIEYKQCDTQNGHNVTDH